MKKCTNCYREFQDDEVMIKETSYEAMFGAYSHGGMIRTPLRIEVCPYYESENIENKEEMEKYYE